MECHALRHFVLGPVAVAALGAWHCLPTLVIAGVACVAHCVSANFHRTFPDASRFELAKSKIHDEHLEACPVSCAYLWSSQGFYLHQAKWTNIIYS